MYCHIAPPLVRKTAQFEILSLTILVLPFAPRGNKGSPGNCSLPTRLGGASRSRARWSQVCRSSSSTCWTVPTPLGVTRVQAHRWRKARAEQSELEGGWHTSKKREAYCSLQRHHEKQLAQLRFFEQAVESSRERLVSLFDDWNYPSRPKMVELPDVAREERETACSELP